MVRERGGPGAGFAGLVGLVVALAFSWVPGFWYDEAASLAAARRPLASLPHLLSSVDLVHSQYYLLLHLWGSIAGWSQFATRLPSALAAGITAALVWRLASMWSARRATWVATALVITIPGIAWSAQQARPFALAAMWLVLTTWLLVRPGGRATLRWALVFVVAALAVWAELYTVLAFPGLLLIALHHKRFRAALVTLGLVGCAAVPFALAVSRQKGQLGGHPGFDLMYMPGTVLHASFFVGPHDGGTGVPLTAAASYLTMVVVLALAGWGLIGGSVSRSLWLGLVTAALLPPVVMFVAAMPSGSLYSTRYFAFTVPFLALAAGLGAAGLSSRVAVVLAALAVAGSLPLLVAMRLPYGHAGQDYGATADAVRRIHPTAVAYDAPRARATAVAYPSAFRGARDLTAGESAEASGTLFGTLGRLTPEKVRGTGTLVLVSWQPGQAGERNASSVIREGGCIQVQREVVAKVALTTFTCPPPPN